MANKTFHIPKSAIVKTEDNVSILEGKQQTITTDASAVATLTNTDGFKAAHYSIAAERDGEVTTTTTTTTTTVTGSGTSIDADTKLLLNANYIYDESFSKRDITLNNTEVVRKGYYFSGTSNSIVPAGNMSDFNFTGEFTVESWVNFSSNGLFYINIDEDADPWPGAIGIGIDASKKPYLFYFEGSSSTSYTIYHSDAITYGSWHHISVTRDSSNVIRLFLDGVAASTTRTSSYSFNHKGVRIGSSYNQSGPTGYLANFKIYNGSALYTSDFTELSTSEDNLSLSLLGDDDEASRHTLTFNNVRKTGKFGQGSFYFDGSSHISTSVPFSPGTGDFTIEAWINLDSVTTSQNVVETIACSENWYQTGYDGGWLLIADFRSNTNTIVFYGTNGNPASGGSASAVTATNCGLQANKWHHVAVCRESGTLTIYVDGVAKKSESSYTFSVTQGLTHIGRKQPNHHYGQADYFNGYIDDLRISKGVARYTAAFNNDLPTAPLETEDSRTKLLLNTNSALQDFEIGRMALAPTYAGDTKVVRRGYAFDGSDKITIASSSDFSFGTGDFTVEMWFYQKDTNASSTQRGVFQLSTISGGLAGGTRAGGIFINTGVHAGGTANNQGMRCIIGNSEAIIGTSTAAVKLNAWNHVVVSRESGTARFFLNGELLDSESSSENITGTNMVLGGYHSDSYLMNGYMSDIRITKGEAVYTSAFTPPQSLTAGTNTKLLLTGGESDESSSEHSLTFSGAYPTAKFGDGSYYFDGSGDYITVSDYDGLHFGTSEDFTVEFWLNALKNDIYLLDKSVGGHADFSMQLSSNGRIRLLVDADADNAYTLDAYTATTGLDDGEWHHIAWVRSGSQTYIFIDGDLDSNFSNNTTTYNVTSTADLAIGGSAIYGEASDKFKGYIDDFRISSTARYTASFDVPTSELGSGTSTTTTTETTTTTTTGSSDVVLTKVHLVHDGSNVYFTEYGRTATDDDFLELSASYDAGVAKLHASTTSGSATLELTKKEFDFSAD